jgi:hypothetical protein
MNTPKTTTDVSITNTTPPVTNALLATAIPNPPSAAIPNPMPPETVGPGDKEEMSDDSRHRFLAYLIGQLEPLRQSSEHNWLIQAVLITLATFHLYNPELVEGVAAAIKLPMKSLDLVIPLVLTYLHIRLGYLVNAYLFIRDGISDIIKSFKFRPEVFAADAGERMLRSNTLVELLALNYEGVKKLNPRSIVLPILVFLVAAAFALNHALIFIYLGRLVGHHRNLSIPIGIFLVILLGACYLHFFEKAKRNAARFVAAGAIILTPVLFLALRWTLYDVW